MVSLNNVSLIKSYNKSFKKINIDTFFIGIFLLLSPIDYVLGDIITSFSFINIFAIVIIVIRLFKNLGSAFQKKGLLKKIIILLYKKSLKNVEKVFFENPANKDVFIKNNIIPAEKAVILNGAGVDLQKFEYFEMIDSYPITFLFIGHIMKEKGINEFINAATKLKQEYQDNIKFEIIGNYEEDYKKELETLNDLDVINYYGFQHDVKPYVEKAHCIILSSYHEGMSNSLLEAAAMGRPLIASDINGCKEAIIEGQSGYLCKVKDTESLYQKMKEYYNLPFENKQKMGQASRKHMEDMFDKDKIVEKTILNLLGN